MRRQNMLNYTKSKDLFDKINIMLWEVSPEDPVNILCSYLAMRYGRSRYEYNSMSEYLNFISINIMENYNQHRVDYENKER